MFLDKFVDASITMLLVLYFTFAILTFFFAVARILAVYKDSTLKQVVAVVTAFGLSAVWPVMVVVYMRRKNVR